MSETPRAAAPIARPEARICLMFDGTAEAAARFYVATFPDSHLGAIQTAPADFPAGKAGDVLTVAFTLMGTAYLAVNGGARFRHSEAVSIQVVTADQAETDALWSALIAGGGAESQCGWCRDRFGLSWQVTPRTLVEALATGGAEAARAFTAMLPMRKIDVARIDAARAGRHDPVMET